MESFTWGLMGYPRRSKEDYVAENDLNCVDLAQEVSVGKNLSVWSKDFFVYFGEECGCFLPLSEESA